MKLKPLNQDGLVPLLIVILLVIGAVIYLVYGRVLHLQR